jgi:cytochrome c
MDLQKRRGWTMAGIALAIAAGPSALASSDFEVPGAVELCLSCHTFQPGEPELEGPTLWGVVGRRIAGAPDYPYSDALRSQVGHWDRSTLDRFLASPQAFAPGVNMTFGGVKNAADRKVVIDFLETLTPEGALVDAGAGEPSEDPAGSP